MSDSTTVAASHFPASLLTAGSDHFGERRSLGVSTLTFKLMPNDETGVFVIENAFHTPGGPARHLHLHQDEWFYVLEGTFAFEVGDDKHSLTTGDSLFAPRQVPHVWAFVGDKIGRILIAFLPAGQMEAFFREVTKASAMPPNDPLLWRAHGMELLGPPLAVA
jgi:quercetin dioxygenase-like cupin family protein